MTVWNQDNVQRDATEGYESLHHLDGKQTKALEALAAGGSHAAAAAAGGVHRVTVTRWVNHHPEFIAEMNRSRAELLLEVRNAAARLTTASLHVMLEAVLSGDAEAAFRWLRLLGAANLLTAETGPLDAADVIEDVRLSLPNLSERAIDQSASVVDAKSVIRERLTS